MFRGERARFLRENPDIEQVEVLLSDTNGIPRGKWLPVSALDSLERDGFRLPVSVLGETPSFAGRLDSEYGLSAGDPDGICAPVPGTLKRVPWRERPAAQLLVSMCDDDGTTPHPLDSRGILARAQSGLARLGLFPVAAMELEFSLYRPASHPDGPLQPLPGFSCNRLYELDALDDLAPFLDAVDRAAELQGIPLAGMISELAPGQFELNLAHIRDACRVADHAVLFRRLVKRVAKRHGLDATFMAKPDGAKPGNGCHVHLSLVSDTGTNRFDEPGAAPGAAGAFLRHAVAGLIHTAPDVQLVFAPNVNLAPSLHARRVRPPAGGMGIRSSKCSRAGAQFLRPECPARASNRGFRCAALPGASGNSRRDPARIGARQRAAPATPARRDFVCRR